MSEIWAGMAEAFLLIWSRDADLIEITAEIFASEFERIGDRLRRWLCLWGHGWPFAGSATAVLLLPL